MNNTPAPPLPSWGPSWHHQKSRFRVGGVAKTRPTPNISFSAGPVFCGTKCTSASSRLLFPPSKVMVSRGRCHKNRAYSKCASLRPRPPKSGATIRERIQNLNTRCPEILHYYWERTLNVRTITTEISHSYKETHQKQLF